MEDPKSLGKKYIYNEMIFFFFQMRKTNEKTHLKKKDHEQGNISL